MSIEIYKNKEEEIRAIASVTSLFLTGSFILREFGIQPFLETGYNFLTGSSVPEFFLIALGIIGVYEIVQNLVGTLIINPIMCMFDGHIKQPNFGALVSTDLIGPFLIFAVYTWVLSLRAIQPTQSVLWGGAGVIILTPLLNVVPRAVGRRVEDDCFFSIKVLLVSLPLSVLTFLPAIVIIEYFG